MCACVYVYDWCQRYRASLSLSLSSFLCYYCYAHIVRSYSFLSSGRLTRQSLTAYTRHLFDLVWIMEYLSADGVLTGLQIVCGLSADGVTVLITLRPHFNMSSTKFLHFTFHLQTLRCDDIARSRIFKAWKHSKCIHHNKYFVCTKDSYIALTSHDREWQLDTSHRRVQNTIMAFLNKWYGPIFCTGALYGVYSTRTHLKHILPTNKAHLPQIKL